MRGHKSQTLALKCQKQLSIVNRFKGVSFSLSSKNTTVKVVSAFRRKRRSLCLYTRILWYCRVSKPNISIKNNIHFNHTLKKNVVIKIDYYCTAVFITVINAWSFIIFETLFRWGHIIYLLLNQWTGSTKQKIKSRVTFCTLLSLTRENNSINISSGVFKYVTVSIRHRNSKHNL